MEKVKKNIYVIVSDNDAFDASVLANHLMQMTKSRGFAVEASGFVDSECIDLFVEKQIQITEHMLGLPIELDPNPFEPKNGLSKQRRIKPAVPQYRSPFTVSMVSVIGEANIGKTLFVNLFWKYLHNSFRSPAIGNVVTRSLDPGAKLDFSGVWSDEMVGDILARVSSRLDLTVKFTVNQLKAAPTLSTYFINEPAE